MMRESSRRQYLSGLTAGAITLTAGCTAISGDEPGSWPFRGYDAQNTRHNPNASISENPTLGWQTDFPIKYDYHVSRPAISEDRVFVGTIDDLWEDGPSLPGRIVALDEDGSTIWSSDVQDGSLRIPVVAGDLVVAPETPVAFDANDGSERWRREFDGVSLFPLDDTLIAKRDGSLVALDIETGNDRWETNESSTGAPISNGDVIVVERYDSAALSGTDAETGEHRWTESGFDGDVYAAPKLITAGVVVRQVVLDGEHQLYALDTETGTEQWQTTFDRQFSGELVALDEVVVVPVKGADGTSLVALDATDGTEQWTVGTVPEDSGDPVAADDQFLFTTDDQLIGLSRDGASQWTVALDIDFEPRRPTVAGSRVYLTSELNPDDGMVVVYE